ncbi:MAG TPA: hypothetical protein VK993_11905, partial [Chthoniobacterales bacterium]|nr:hypothetical protein [Chthoniobacterales bacterium]
MRISARFALCSLAVAALAFAAAADGATPGAWAVVRSPSIGNQNTPYAVTCTSPTQCFAVGDYWQYPNGFPTPQTLIQQWNGTSWSIVPSPNSSSTQTNGLSGVACTSSSDCWAVGSFAYINYDDPVFPRGYAQTLIQHWDGTAWRIVPSPNTSAKESNGLSDVTCTSASDCWAVGASTYYDNAIIFPTFRAQAVIQRWDGRSWKMFPAPAGASLSAVTCVSGNDCWAVGNGLIVHWDGASWKGVPEPGGRESPNHLNDVTCTSSTDCWAVGARETEAEKAETVIEHWDGSSWSIVPSPNPRAYTSILNAVACSSPSQCWAVGTYYDGEANRTLIQQWNGVAWTIVSSPSPSSRLNRLRGVDCTSDGQCFAVGDHLQSSGQLTLFEVYTPPPPPADAPASTFRNLSTRLPVENGDDALIGGFIITGSAPKKVIIRAIGPSLTAKGVDGALADPTLELNKPDGTTVFNDNWKENQAAVAATTIPPERDEESAIVATLAPGVYTAVVRGKGGATGGALVEVYDLDAAAPSLLANISTRGRVQTGGNVMIGGFIV